MKLNTNISNVVERNGTMNQYDAEVKKVLSDPQILAWILKYTTEEMKDYSIECIISCIVGKPEVGSRYVSPGHFTKSVEGMNTEDSVQGEGKVIYDIRFRVRLPIGDHIGMIINVEAQKDPNPGYDIVTRGVFYCARMLSGQMGNDISAKEYDALQKVYSIWICLDAPQKAEHTIVRYRMQREDVHGHAKLNSRYDLMELVMVYLGREETAEKGTNLHGLLSTVLSNKLQLSDKKNRLKQKYDIVTSVELEGGLVSMCNLSELIWERSMKEGHAQGMAQGLEQGLEQGKLEMLLQLLEQGLLTKEQAAHAVNMEVEAFEQYVQQMNNKKV